MSNSTYTKWPLSRRPTVLIVPFRLHWLGMTPISKFLVIFGAGSIQLRFIVAHVMLSPGWLRLRGRSNVQ